MSTSSSQATLMFYPHTCGLQYLGID
jgi:hypothetical protein